MNASHASLNTAHYREVRENPRYAMAGMMEVQIEEMLMNMPIIPSPPQEKEEPELEPEWSRRQWDIIQQLRGEIAYFRNKLAEHMTEHSPSKGKHTGGGIAI